MPEPQETSQENPLAGFAGGEGAQPSLDFIPSNNPAHPAGTIQENAQRLGPKVGAPALASVPGYAALNGIPPGYSAYTLKNGKVTLERDADKAVYTHPAVGTEGNPGWIYGKNAGDKYKQPAPDSLSPTVSGSPRLQPWTSPKTGKTYFKDMDDGTIFSDKSLNGNPAGWYKEDATYVDPAKKKPFEQDSGIGARRGYSVTPDLTPAGLGARLNAPLQAAQAATTEFAGNILKSTADLKSPIDLALSLAHRVGLTEKDYGATQAQDTTSGQMNQAADYLHKTAEQWQPPENARSPVSDIAGMAPLFAASATPYGAPLVASSFLGSAKREVQQLKDSGVNVSPLSEAAYVAGNGALGLVQLPGNKAVTALGKNMLFKLAAETGVGAAHMGMYSAGPTAFRDMVWGTGEDPLAAFAQGAKSGAWLGLMGGATRGAFQASARPNGAASVQPASPESLNAAMLNMPLEGQTPLEFAKSNNVSVTDARTLLSSAASDPNHPVTVLPNGKFGHTAESIGEYLDTEADKAGLPPLQKPPEPAPQGQIHTQGEPNATGPAGPIEGANGSPHSEDHQGPAPATDQNRPRTGQEISRAVGSAGSEESFQESEAAHQVERKDYEPFQVGPYAMAPRVEGRQIEFYGYDENSEIFPHLAIEVQPNGDLFINSINALEAKGKGFQKQLLTAAAHIAMENFPEVDPNHSWVIGEASKDAQKARSGYPGTVVGEPIRGAQSGSLPTGTPLKDVLEYKYKGGPDAIREQGPNAVGEQPSGQEGAGNQGREGVGQGNEGQEITRTGQPQAYTPQALKEVLAGPGKPGHAIIVLGPSGSGRTTEATAALSHTLDTVALDGTTKTPGQLRAQIKQLRDAGVDHSVMLVHPPIPDLISRALDSGKPVDVSKLAQEIYGPESPLNQFVKAGNSAKVGREAPGLSLVMGDTRVEGDEALTRARSMAETLNAIGPERGAERIADEIAKQLSNGQYDPKLVKDVLGTFPASRQDLAADLSTRLGAKYKQAQPVEPEPVAGGRAAPGEASPNTAVQNNTGTSAAVPLGVGNTGPAGVQAPSAEAAPGAQAPGIGQTPGGPGGQAPGGVGPEAPGPGEAPQVPSVQPAPLKQSFKVNGVDVPLMTQEHQERFAAAEKQKADREALVAQMKATAPTAAEDPEGYKVAKDARAALRKDIGIQFMNEKKAIAREALQAQQEANPDISKEDLLKYTQNMRPNDPDAALAHQALTTLSNAVEARDQDHARTAILYGDTNFEDFKKTMQEQQGDRFDEKTARKWFDDMSQRLDYSQIMPRLDAAKTSGEKDLAVADLLNATSAMIPGENGSHPTLPPDNYRAMSGEPMASPTRDLTLAEKNLYPGSRSHLLKGIFGFGREGVFKPGEHYIIDLAKAANLRMNFTKEVGDWARGLLSDVKSSVEQITTMNQPLRQEYDKNLIEGSALIKGGIEAQKDPMLYANWKNSTEGKRVVELHQRNQEIFANVNKNTMTLIPDHPDVRMFAYLDNQEGSPLYEAAKSNMSQGEIEIAEKAKAFYQDMKTELDKRHVPTFDSGTNYINHIPFALSDREDVAHLQKQNMGGNKLQMDKGDPQQLSDMNFGSRDPNAPAFMPSLTESLNAYIPTVAKKIAFEPAVQKWGPSIESNFNGKAPRLSELMADHINGLLNRPDTSNPVSNLVNYWKDFSYIQKVGLSTSTGFKHIMKSGLEYTNLGASPLLNAAFQRHMPDSVLDSPMVQKAMKAIGMADVVDPKVREAIGRTIVQTKAINAEVEGLGITDSNFKQGISDIQKATQNVKQGSTLPTSAIEKYFIGLNMMATHIAGKEAGLDAVQTVRQMLESNMATNFNGAVDAPRYINPSKDATTNAVLGGATMFSSTPFKIMEQYLSYALQPNAVDAFGTQNGVKLARTMLWLGTVAAIQNVSGKNILGSSFHPPFVNIGEGWQEALKTPPLFGDLYNMGSMVHNPSPENLESKSTKLLVPSAVTKGKHILSGQLPEGYSDRGSYLLGVKDTEEGQTRNEHFQEKATRRENKSARKSNARAAGETSTITDNLQKMFSSKAQEPVQP